MGGPYQKSVSPPSLRSKSSQNDPQKQRTIDFKQTLKYPQTLRLRTRFEFRKLSKEGARLVGKFLCVDVCVAKKSKLGITVPGRYGSSPERNRFKRLVREAFRQNYLQLPSLEMNVLPRQAAKTARMKQIAEELVKLLCS